MNKVLPPIFFGKILLARFLGLSLKRFDAYVKAVDADPGWTRLSGFVEIGRLKGSNLANPLDKGSVVFGEIISNGFYPIFLYHAPSFVREYRFDEDNAWHFLRDGGGNEDLRKLVRRLRLINTRNRTAHALIGFLLRYQTRYFQTADPIDLKPLTLAEIVKGLDEEKDIDVHRHRFDPTRISRLLKSFPVLFPNGRVRGLSDLCPGSKEICCHFVDRVIKSEKSLILEGSINGPLSDDDVAGRVESLFGARISRRTVSHIRRELGIPIGKNRAGGRTYHEATADFSPPIVLTSKNVRTHVPDEAGVYEIRSFVPGLPEEIVYIGSAGNLRKRLTYHLYATFGNPCLRGRISEGVRFRYRIFREEWRTAEREIYRAFLATYGKSPECNRVSP